MLDPQLRSTHNVPAEGESIYGTPKRPAKPDYKINATTGCWEWLKGLTSAGYPNGPRKHGLTKPHRIYFYLATGQDPTGLDVHHKCHNPRCVNPDHLEAVSKVKHLRDHRRGDSVFSEQDIADIRASRLKSHELAEIYGVPDGTIRAIWQTKVDWKGVGVQAKPIRHCDVCGVELPSTMNRHAMYCSKKCCTAASRRRMTRERKDAANRYQREYRRKQKAA